MVKRYGMSLAPNYEEIPINHLLDEIHQGNVDSIEIYGNDLLVKTKDGAIFLSRKEEDFSLVEYLSGDHGYGKDNAVRVYVQSSKSLGGLGPRTFGKREELVFLGREISEERDYGDRIAEEIDQEVRELTHRAYEQAQKILTERKAKLVQIAEYLIEHEAVSGDELARLFDRDDPSKEGDTGTPAVPPKAPTPYAPKPSQPPMPHPAPSLSSRSFASPETAAGDVDN
jgi:hypothetical protein